MVNVEGVQSSRRDVVASSRVSQSGSKERELAIKQDDICKVLQNGIGYRDFSSLDEEVSFEVGEDGQAKTTESAESIKMKYINNFVTKLQFMAVYVINSKINPKFQQMSFQLVKVVMPPGDDCLCSN